MEWRLLWFDGPLCSLCAQNSYSLDSLYCFVLFASVCLSDLLQLMRVYILVLKQCPDLFIKTLSYFVDYITTSYIIVKVIDAPFDVYVQQQVLVVIARPSH